MRAGEIAERLSQEAEDIAAMLLPNGKRDGGEWKAGSVDGEEGKSLSVRIAGGKAGVWKDFATGEGGDLLDLYCAVNNCPIADGLKWAKNRLGIRDVHMQGSYKTKPTVQRPKCNRPKSAVLEWLTTERKLSESAIEAYRIAESDREVIFPYLDSEGELTFIKHRSIDDKHKMRVGKGSIASLFGWQAVPDAAREVVICEGELDAPSWWMLGYPALSVPNGAQGSTWIENEYENLERFDVIYLAFDSDEAGKKAVPGIVDRLGRERCRVIELTSFKDANDLIRAGINALQAQEIVSRARTLDPEELKPARDFDEKVFDILSGKQLGEAGYMLPWAKGRGIRLRNGEVILLAGVNGHGKSEGAGHILAEMMNQDVRGCLASMEFKPERALARLVRQLSGVRTPSREYHSSINNWLDGKLWVFDVVGSAKADRIIDVFTYARRRYGIEFFIIDNLAKCGFAEDDYNGQKKFVDKLTDFAKEHDVIVLLVLHMRKKEDESRAAGKMDIKGTGAITDMADTVLIWWRNKKKEESQRIADATGEQLDSEIAGKPDAMCICEKQRNGEDEPRLTLWFDRDSHQFLETSASRPKMYVRYSAAPLSAGFEWQT